MYNIVLKPDLYHSKLDILISRGKTPAGDLYSLPLSDGDLARSLEPFRDFSIQRKLPAANITVVLPDDYVTVDLITLPNLKSRLGEMLKAEFEKLYVNNRELVFRVVPFAADKNQASFLCCIVRKDVLQCVQAQLEELKTADKTVTFAANALTQALLLYKNTARRQPGAICCLGEEFTAAAVSDRTMTLGGLNFPFGLATVEKYTDFIPFSRSRASEGSCDERKNFLKALALVDGGLNAVIKKFRIDLKTVFLILPEKYRGLYEELENFSSNLAFEPLSISPEYECGNPIMAGAVFASGGNKDFIF